MRTSGMKSGLVYGMDQWFEETMYGALSYLSYLQDLGFGGAKTWGDVLKSPFGMAMQATSGGGNSFYGEGRGGGGSHYVTMLH